MVWWCKKDQTQELDWIPGWSGRGRKREEGVHQHKATDTRGTGQTICSVPGRADVSLLLRLPGLDVAIYIIEKRGIHTTLKKCGSFTATAPSRVDELECFPLPRRPIPYQRPLGAR